MLSDVGDHYGKADTLAHLGDTHQATGNLAAAREAWERALVILEEIGPHSDADTVRAKLAALDTDD